MDSAGHTLDPETLAILRELEESLWRAGTRYSNAQMDRILAEDFIELGRSGRIYAREEMFFDASAQGRIYATLPLPHFHARYLTDDVVQVIYVSEVVHGGKTEKANRSSIWTRAPEGWKLRFHQGTPV